MPKKSMEDIFRTKQQQPEKSLEDIFSPQTRTGVAPILTPSAITQPTLETVSTLREAPPLTLPELGREAFANIPESAGKFLGGIAQAVTSPVETTEALVKTALGGVQKLIGEPEQRQVTTPQGKTINVAGKSHADTFNAVSDFYKDRYGSVEQAKRTIAKDPVGALADASVLFTGAGAAATKAGQLSKIKAVAKAGEVLKKTGAAIEPLAAPIKTVKGVTKFTGRRIGDFLGITTGTGADTIREGLRAARQGGPQQQAFKAAMRGATSKENIVNTARDALYSLKDTRGTQYRQSLEKISGIADEMDIVPIKKRLDNITKNFNIKKTKKGEFDFSRSKIDISERAKVKEIIKMVEDWGSQPGDLTPLGMDTLKQLLDDYYSPSKNSRAIVQSLRGEVAQKLSREVPGYKQMVSSYKKLTDDIEGIEKALSLGTRSGSDTAVKKLTSALKNNNEFRAAFVNRLDEFTEGQLMSQIAGASFNPAMPTGAVGRMTSAIEAGIILTALDPKFLAVMGLSSPRIVGEFVNTLGSAVRIESGIERVGLFGTLARQTAFQAGRPREVLERTEVAPPETGPTKNRLRKILTGFSGVGP